MINKIEEKIQSASEIIITKLSNLTPNNLQPGSKTLLFDQKVIPELLTEAKLSILKDNMLLKIEKNHPIHIAGDFHGQLLDLLKIFQKSGPPSLDQTYVFLGDYVDRGEHSLETICLLLAYKVKYPNNVYLLRGDHEIKAINQIYGFKDECQRKCGNLEIYSAVNDIFDNLPLAAVVNNKYFCVVGGLSPSLHSLDDINDVSRPLTDQQLSSNSKNQFLILHLNFIQHWWKTSYSQRLDPRGILDGV